MPCKPIVCISRRCFCDVNVVCVATYVRVASLVSVTHNDHGKSRCGCLIIFRDVYVSVCRIKNVQPTHSAAQIVNALAAVTALSRR